MLTENIQKTHEDSLCGSLDHTISEFILLNIFEMSQYSLGDIARQLGLPKSSVASYFSSPRLSGGYPMFQRALRTDLGRRSMVLSLYIRSIREFIGRIPRRLKADTDEALDILADEILKSRKVIIFGQKKYRECVSPLISLLFRKRIPCRYIVTACAGRYEQELLSLTADDLVIFLSPYETFRELNYYISSFPQFSNAVLKSGGRRMFILSEPFGTKEDERIISFPSPANKIEASPAVDLFMYRLFLIIVEKADMDTSQQICIL